MHNEDCAAGKRTHEMQVYKLYIPRIPCAFMDYISAVLLTEECYTRDIYANRENIQGRSYIYRVYMLLVMHARHHVIRYTR